jgi:hypothetical protein
VYPTPFETVNEVTLEKAMELLRQGFMAIKVKQGSPRQLHELPLVVLKSSNKFSGGWTTGAAPNFFLTREGKLTHAVVNGHLIELNLLPTEKFRNRIF